MKTAMNTALSVDELKFSVRVPASSANIGPGFDALGMALTLYFELGIIDGDLPPGAEALTPRHPAVHAFAYAGGSGSLWARSEIPMGRGLGFSGAARVGGVIAALRQKSSAANLLSVERENILAISTELEGHPDNVAASLVGGVTASASGKVARLPLALRPKIVVWVPESKTSTHESRTKLAETVSLKDAVFNIGHATLLMAALAAGDVATLRAATQDRLHQDLRLAAAPTSREAIGLALKGPAWCAWLSGSGPTVAAMCSEVDAQSVAASLPREGEVKILDIDLSGAQIAGAPKRA